MKKLPVGIQTFRKIIEGGYLYADKTQYIYNLLQSSECCFLS
ncbi:MAG: AAA family ATPase, partial [Clostridiales bacterium]|nr:AAA family ATPase [Clostridiales bacterium]